MIGHDRIEIVIKYNVHGSDSERLSISLENMIDTFGRPVFPAIYVAAVAGLVKPLRMTFVKLVHILGVADDMVIGMLAGRRVKIADD